MRTHNLRSSFGYAIEGIAYVVKTQRNFRIHASFGLLVLLVGGLLHLSWVEFAILVGVIMAVLMAEMLNTIIETAIDLVSPDYHPLAKITKDVAAGAVLLMSLGAVLVGLLIFGPHLLALLPAPGH